MRIIRIIGIILATLGIYMVVFYSYTAYSAQQVYVKLMCAVTWASQCTTTNNLLMWAMGMLAIGLVLIAIGGIILVKVIKSRKGGLEQKSNRNYKTEDEY